MLRKDLAEYVSKVVRNRLIANAGQLFAGAAVGQLLLMAAVPVLTRLLEPPEFGTYALFTAVVGIVAAVASAKYDAAIVVAQDDTEAGQLVVLTLRLSLIGAFLAGIVVLVGRQVLDVHWSLLLIAPSLFLLAVIASGRQWEARHLRYATVSKLQMINVLVYIVAAVFLARTAWIQDGLLVVGYVFANAVVAGAYFFVLHRESALSCSVDLLEMGRKYSDFPKHVLPFTLLGLLGQSTLVLLLPYRFSLAEVGFYAVANRLMYAPVAFVGGAVSEALRSEFAARMREGRGSKSLYIKSSIGLLVFSSVVFSVAALIAPPAFEMLLGSNYREAGNIAQWMVAGAAAWFVILPVQNVAIVFGHTGRALFAQGVTVLVPFLLVLLGLWLDLSISRILLIWSLGVLVSMLLHLAVGYSSVLDNRRDRVAGGKCVGAP